MVYCIQAQLAFRNAARRDAVSQTIQTRIAQSTTWGPVYRTNSVNMAGQASVTLEVRFATKAEQNSAWADIQNYVGTGVNGPLTGSELTRHDCPHDEEHPYPCVIAERRDW